MSSRPVLKPFSVVKNGNMAAQIISKPTIVNMLSMLSYDISWTGTSPMGAITVQVSNTYAENAAGVVQTAGNWTTLTLSSTTNVATNTGNGFIDVDATAGYAMRLVYTPTSGTGTMQVVVHGKVS